MSTPVAHDVVVLGTGAAGLVAALAANEQGASVGLYEKGDVVGGTNRAVRRDRMDPEQSPRRGGRPARQP